MDIGPFDFYTEPCKLCALLPAMRSSIAREAAHSTFGLLCLFVRASLRCEEICLSAISLQWLKKQTDLG
jgi:hypothetical protein